MRALVHFLSLADLEKRLWHLRKFTLLKSVTDAVLRNFAGQLELIEIKRKDVVYLPGDPGDSLYLIHGGRCKISKVTQDGKALTLAYLGPNEFFGEAALVDGPPRNEMAEALEHCIVSKIPYQKFNNMLADHGPMALEFIKKISQQRNALENKLEMLVFKDVTGKLAHLLLHLGEKYGVEESRGLILALKITHQDMANLIGSTRETVSLTLSQFKKKNLIDTDGRKIILLDKENIKALC